MIRRTAADLQDVHAMNCRVYAMSPADRDKWYKDHPLSDYEEAAAFLADGEDDAPEVPRD